MFIQIFGDRTAESTGQAALFNRNYPIMVVGHADPREDVSDLSRRRAEVVRGRLVGLGIAPGRITVAIADMAEIGDASAALAEPQHRRAEIERR